MGSSVETRLATGKPPSDSPEVPATIAFRNLPASGRTLAFHAGRANKNVPTVLHLPDVRSDAGEFAPVAQNPLINKLLWAASGVLALTAIVLAIMGRPDSPRSASQAPRWQQSAGSAARTAGQLAPVTQWNVQNARPAASSSAAEATDFAPPALDVPGGASANSPAILLPPSAEGYPPGGAESQFAPPPAATGGALDQQPLDNPAPAGPEINNPADPWPGDPAWPSQTRGGPMTPATRTARAQAVAPTGPNARFEGGIRNQDLSPNNDGTRPSLY